MIKPFIGNYPITQRFGENKGSYKYKCRKDGSHNGVDYGLPQGTLIVAAEAGTVIRSEMDSTGYGLMVMIQHSDGSACIYAHLRSTVQRPVGSKVDQGALLGFSGNSGNSTGPHLHFEYRDVARDCTTCSDPLPMITETVEEEKPMQPQQRPVEERNKVAWASLNVRYKPGLLPGGIIGQAATEQEFELAGKPMIKADGYTWVPIICYVALEGLK